MDRPPSAVVFENRLLCTLYRACLFTASSGVVTFSRSATSAQSSSGESDSSASTAARAADAQVAVEGYQASFEAMEQRHRSGFASLLELEESRRMLLNARMALSALERERMAAWIALYRAAGGGWRQGDPVLQDAAPTTSAPAADPS